MPKNFISKTQKIGEFGEKIVCEYLIKKDFIIVDKNYYKNIGEIDIVAKKDNILHFIEVKSVSCETIDSINNLLIKPENNFTKNKAIKFKKIIEMYLVLNNVSRETDINIDLFTVYIDKTNKKAKLRAFWNIILE
jgi:putative endonuclease